MSAAATMLKHPPVIGISKQIYLARTAAGLTQAQLAERLGTCQSVIARLENTTYSAHSLKMLWRIARALGMLVDVSLVMVDQPQALKRKPRTKAA